jgi:HEXXH motif-containing protein
VPARRLRWRKVWGEATALLERTDPERSAHVAEHIRCVIPLEEGPTTAGPSGAVFATLPASPAHLLALLRGSPAPKRDRAPVQPA